MPSPKLETLAEAVLLRLYELAQTSDLDSALDDIPKLFRLNLTKKQTRLALEELEENGWCNVDRFNGYATITKSGYLAVERALEDPTTFVRAYHEKGDDWLSETGGAIESDLPKADTAESTLRYDGSALHDGSRQYDGGVPASDRYVATTDNQEGFDDLVTHLNKIRDEFAKDHKKNELGGEVGQHLLSEIEAAKAQVNSGWVRLQQLSDGLRPALEKAALTYPGIALIVHDATAVVVKILQAFGI